MENYIIYEMDQMGADGVDFVPICVDKFPPPIIRSYTREEVLAATSFPRTNRMYWKILNGEKVYIKDL